MKKIKVLTLTLFIFSMVFSVFAQASKNKLSQTPISEIEGYKKWAQVTSAPQFILNPSSFG